MLCVTLTGRVVVVVVFVAVAADFLVLHVLAAVSGGVFDFVDASHVAELAAA